MYWKQSDYCQLYHKDMVSADKTVILLIKYSGASVNPTHSHWEKCRWTWQYTILSRKCQKKNSNFRTNNDQIISYLYRCRRRPLCLTLIIGLPASRNHLMTFWVILAMDQSEREIKGQKKRHFNLALERRLIFYSKDWKYFTFSLQ